MNPNDPYNSMVGQAPPGGNQSSYLQMFQPPPLPPSPFGAQRGQQPQQPGQMQQGQQQGFRGGLLNSPFLQAIAAWHQRQKMGNQPGNAGKTAGGAGFNAGMNAGPSLPGMGMPTGQAPRPPSYPWASSNPSMANTGIMGSAQPPQGQAPPNLSFRPPGQQMFGPPGSNPP